MPAGAGGSGHNLVVTSCADDGSYGTLRSVLALAQSQDTVDLTQLRCSRITLEMGALENNAGTITIAGPGRNRLTIDGNYKGGVFHLTGPATISGLTVTHGRVTADIAVGGCIEAYLGVELDSVDVLSCAALGNTYASGGGVNSAYFERLVSSTVSGNVASADSGRAQGGGVNGPYFGVTAHTSTISDNVAEGMLGSIGGGFNSRGLAGVYDTTIDNNTADYGGGIYCQRGFLKDGYCKIVNSTVSGNTARVSGGGVVTESADIDVMSSTIASNSALDGNVGGVLIAGHFGAPPLTYIVNLRSTIVANNAASAADLAPDIDTDLGDAVFAIGDNDLLTSVGNIIPSSYISDDPMLAPLAANGGSTRTHALLPGSPAIDAGNNAAGLATDQRGSARVAGPAADIGAYEVQPDAIFADGFESK